MSVHLNRLSFIKSPKIKKSALEPIDPKKIHIRASTTLHNNRISTVKNLNESVKVEDKSNRKEKFPYSGLSIGYMKLQIRNRKASIEDIPPLKYSHFFSDMYFNSETISFPKVEKQEIPENIGKNSFLLPSKMNFRRLKHKIWTDIKAKEDELPGFNSFTARSVGKAYDLNMKKKELIPVTKFRSKDMGADNMGLRVKGILKPLKNEEKK